ncbi:MAG: hypothetical protein KIS66_04185 [Fimbriimonadaceae bacterium]|nr:hypothetical protein [Fimbriimonadaceae bacterium]
MSAPRRFPDRRFGLVPVAESGAEFDDFGPYAPAMGDDGTVAFTARTREGRDDVFLATESGVRAANALNGPGHTIVSHPDLNARGGLCAYVELASGERALLLANGKRVAHFADRASGFHTVGPLGPTLHDGGTVAFRAERESGRAGIYLADPVGVRVVAEAGDRFVGFDGLPVGSPNGSVVYRANRRDGGEGVYRWTPQGTMTVVETGDRFAALGRFPSANEAGEVAFAATDHAGIGGVYVATPDGIETVAEGGAFGTYRGALIGEDGAVVFFATPVGGSLGAFSGPDPESHRVLEIGRPLVGAGVADFALNAVSLNCHGQIVVRIRLDDGRQLIAVAEPN